MTDRALAPHRLRYDDDRARPRYHFGAPTGWLNDPNGLSQWDGTYHLFYQFNPDSPRHANIQWGHATSTDLVNWEDRPIALAPDPEGPDREGCWSGVLVNNNGTPTIIYSGHAGDAQLPCLAVGDSTLDTWTKDPSNPLLAGPPPGTDTTAFRDHCVWREGNTWYQLIGSGFRGIGGAALLYESPDLHTWNYRGPILIGNTTETDPVWTGTMWECVDLFQIDGTHVLVVSVWDEGDTHYPIYFTGSYTDGIFTPEAVRTLDLGLRHFYAPQSFRDDKGRRIIIGWIQEGRTDQQTLQAGWSGVLSVPRVLTLTPSGRLHHAPVPELTRLRGEHISVVSQQLSTGQDIIIDQLGDGAADLDLHLTAEPGTILQLEVLRTPAGEECTTIAIDWGRHTIALDRSASSLSPTDSTPLGGDIELLDESLHLRVLIDRSAIEVFANGTPIAARVYPTRADSTGARLAVVHGTTHISRFDAWEMNAAGFAEQADLPLSAEL
ncbi:glycoside hydrolase family 32 protein [Streptomyces niveus]|uniref:glycoside hydrolase family 32 protein n=1 Tax=Streptomyces niveus TaxID=193462 RepID=UPI0036D3D9FE